VYSLDGGWSNLDSNLLIHTLLLLLDLLLQLLNRCSVGRGTVGLEDLDIPSCGLADRSYARRVDSVRTRLLEV
jgi:hypothetical protein